jgi:hypothetical protein
LPPLGSGRGDGFLEVQARAPSRAARTIDTLWQCIRIIAFDLLEQFDLAEVIEAFRALRRLLTVRAPSL